MDFVFSYCFHYSIIWFLSDELWKLKTHFRCFQFHDSIFNDIFVIKHTLKDPLVRSAATFDLFFFSLGSMRWSSSSSFFPFTRVFFFFHFSFPFHATGMVFFIFLLFFFFLLLFFPFHIGFLGLVAFFFSFFSIPFHWVFGFSSSFSFSFFFFVFLSFFTSHNLFSNTQTHKHKPTNMCIHTKKKKKKKTVDFKKNPSHRAAVHIGEIGVVHRWRSWRGKEASEIFMGLGLCFGRDGCCCCYYCCCCYCRCYCFCFMVEANFVNRRVQPLYRNGSHKKVKKLSDEWSVPNRWV